MILAERLLAPVHDAGVDALLLGCTHYPYLARVIGEVMGPDVVLVSSADETAFVARTVLGRARLPRPPRARRRRCRGGVRPPPGARRGEPAAPARWRTGRAPLPVEWRHLVVRRS